MRPSKLEDSFVKNSYIIQRVSKPVNKKTKICYLWNKKKKYHTVEIIPKSIKITERDKSIPIIFNDMTAHFLVGTGTSIYGGGIKLVLWA